MSYFPEPYTRRKNKTKVELDLSNYTTKYDFKSATGVDVSDFAKKADIVTLRLDVDEVDIEKLETVCS